MISIGSLKSLSNHGICSTDIQFSLGLAEKDIKLIVELGHHLGISIPLSEKVYKTYQEAKMKYGEQSPHLSVVRLIEDKHNQKLRKKKLKLLILKDCGSIRLIKV